MADTITVKVPDIGDFQDVEVIEVLVKPGDSVQAEDSLITLESDKASMEIPAPQAGTIGEILVKIGDKVSEGSAIATLQVAAQATEPVGKAPPAIETATPAAAAPAPASGDSADVQADVVVLGSGPGGYTAAFRAADLGLKTVLVERYPALGGVCLNVGCIPSKALLHTAEIITETATMADHGVSFGPPQIDLDKLRGFKDKVIGQLTGGLKGLAKQRKVTVIHGTGRFASPNRLTVETGEGSRSIDFHNAIIAVGSQTTRIPGFPFEDPRLLDSTSALELQDIPKRMLVIGGGIIGLEMATVYDALGSKITVVELMDGLMPGTDRDLVKALQKNIAKRYENIYLKTRVTSINAKDDGLHVSFEGDKAPTEDVFDRVLVSVGRTPNGDRIHAEAAGVAVDERGFIAVDRQQRTNVAHIFAIGDVVGQPMLAHKATHEGKVAAEVCAGHKSGFDARTIPSVAYTNPEVAWMGLTETEAKQQGVQYRKGVFPWAASGRSLSIGRNDGMTKLLFDPDSKRLLGAGIVGPNAGELIAETVLALEMGADAEDIGLTIHPHPTLSETINFAAEVAEGTVTDLYVPKR
ncbi:MAG: dihydrolipoyl dehydrogenase [Gammaproteobacteria bacterium]|nr:dihydrolipoyl dehydrogenase [Gammaproteobacteria bacterium]